MENKTELAGLEIWGLERKGGGRGSRIKTSEMEKYSQLLLAPESLSLIAQDDKDIWQILKAQSFPEEFYTAENLGLKEDNNFSRIILFYFLVL